MQGWPNFGACHVLCRQGDHRDGQAPGKANLSGATAQHQSQKNPASWRPSRLDSPQDPREDAGPQALTVGDWVEVMDAQSQTWCLGRVTQAGGSIGTVAFMAPGAGADDWCEAPQQTSHGPALASFKLLRRVGQGTRITAGEAAPGDLRGPGPRPNSDYTIFLQDISSKSWVAWAPFCDR